MVKVITGIMLLICCVFLLPVSHARAQFFTIELKNGNEIKVEKYWEEGNTVRFFSQGGTIAIPKASIKNIIRHENVYDTGDILYASPVFADTQENKSDQVEKTVPEIDDAYRKDIKERITIANSNIATLTKRKQFYLKQRNRFLKDIEKAQAKIQKVKNTPFITSEDIRERTAIEENQIRDAEQKIKEVDLEIKSTEQLIDKNKTVKEQLESKLATVNQK